MMKKRRCFDENCSFNRKPAQGRQHADHVFDAAIAQYKAMTSYLKWEDMGIITIPNMEKKGSMAVCPQLAQVEALGAQLQSI